VLYDSLAQVRQRCSRLRSRPRETKLQLGKMAGQISCTKATSRWTREPTCMHVSTFFLFSHLLL